jgi:hypothetical protein
MLHSRRLRDEEAQYAIQESTALEYHDFMMMKRDDTGQETDSDHDREPDLDGRKDVVPVKPAESVG